jgi:hypothetical protein
MQQWLSTITRYVRAYNNEYLSNWLGATKWCVRAFHQSDTVTPNS